MTIDQPTFERAVSAYYSSLYRFALSLTHREADACDLTQETFQMLARKGHQIRDASKLKNWLFSTLYHAFIDAKNDAARFQEYDGEMARALDQPDLGNGHGAGERLDAATARQLLLNLAEPFRSTMVLFYLEEHSYKDIAEILHVPIGTVMSRIARGRDMLRAALDARTGPPPQQAVSCFTKPSHDPSGS